MVASADTLQDVRYQPDERPPHAIAFGLGVQYAMMAIAGIVLTPVIVVRAAGGSESYLSWAAFAALSISGVMTVLQAVRIRRLGAGYILLMGTSGAFIAVSVAALEAGGPGLLALLVAVSALFQFALAARLSLFRRVFTPIVAGTVIMLIPVTVLPIVFDMLADVPEGVSSSAAAVSAGATLAVSVVFILLASGVWRLWGPAAGIVAGSVVAGLFGLYDVRSVLEADWFGLPAGAWPGFDFSFGTSFWTLLPAFVFVTLIGAIETVGDGVAVQRVSWRKRRAIDFRAVQGAVAADGLGNLLSGLAATVPNTTYSSSVAVAEITGVAARIVGVYVGIIFVVLAFLPKVMAIILAIPNPVVGAFSLVPLSILFVVGMKIVLRDGIDYRNGIVVGLAFWVGFGFQNQAIFADQINPAWSGLLGNGMTVGGIVAIALTLLLERTRPRRRIRIALDADAFRRVDAFLVEFAARRGLSDEMTDRLRAVGEETLSTLAPIVKAEETAAPDRRLLLVAHSDGSAAELEFIAATDDANLEDRMALLRDLAANAPIEEDVSLRLLRHFASSVRHQQYHDTDVVTVRVEPASGLSAHSAS